MPRRSRKPSHREPAGNGVTALLKELWQAAVTLRGSIEAADYKRYVLPINRQINKTPESKRSSNSGSWIHENERQSFTLADLRGTLLPTLLSGEIRIRQAEKLVERSGA